MAGAKGRLINVLEEARPRPRRVDAFSCLSAAIGPLRQREDRAAGRRGGHVRDGGYGWWRIRHREGGRIEAALTEQHEARRGTGTPEEQSGWAASALTWPIHRGIGRRLGPLAWVGNRLEVRIRKLVPVKQVARARPLTGGRGSRHFVGSGCRFAQGQKFERMSEGGRWSQRR